MTSLCLDIISGVEIPQGADLEGSEKPRKGWGFRIYEARTSGMKRKRGRQMTQAELGDAVGVSGSMIGYYEEERNKPDMDGWEALGRALGVHPAQLQYGIAVAAEDEAHYRTAKPTGSTLVERGAKKSTRKRTG